MIIHRAPGIPPSIILKAVSFFYALFFCAVIIADQPPPPAEYYLIWSPERKYCASLDPIKDITTVYKILDNGSRTVEWTSKGWSRPAFILDNGKTFIDGYFGLNLIPVDYKPDMEMFWISDKGEPKKSVKLNEIIKDFSKLERTASHYFWGYFKGIYALNYLRLETVEHKNIFFDARTGEKVEMLTAPASKSLEILTDRMLEIMAPERFSPIQFREDNTSVQIYYHCSPANSSADNNSFNKYDDGILIELTQSSNNETVLTKSASTMGPNGWKANEYIFSEDQGKIKLTAKVSFAPGAESVTRNEILKFFAEKTGQNAVENDSQIESFIPIENVKPIHKIYSQNHKKVYYDFLTNDNRGDGKEYGIAVFDFEMNSSKILVNNIFCQVNFQYFRCNPVFAPYEDKHILYVETVEMPRSEGLYVIRSYHKLMLYDINNQKKYEVVKGVEGKIGYHPQLWLGDKSLYFNEEIICKKEDILKKAGVK